MAAAAEGGLWLLGELGGLGARVRGLWRCGSPPMPLPSPPSAAGRTGTGVRVCSVSSVLSLFSSFPLFSSALCELFDKADVTKDGTISFAEYQAMCDEYGVKLQHEDRVAIKAIADEDGEVNCDNGDILCDMSCMPPDPQE